VNQVYKSLLLDVFQSYQLSSSYCFSDVGPMEIESFRPSREPLRKYCASTAQSRTISPPKLLDPMRSTFYNCYDYVKHRNRDCPRWSKNNQSYRKPVRLTSLFIG
jgi:hypothetical protein